VSLAKTNSQTIAHRPAWFAAWPIARTSLHLVFRRKLFWVLFAVAMLSFLFMFGAIYLLATLRQQYPQVEQFITSMLKDLDGSGTTFLNFMVAQGTVTMILLAFAGSVLAGNDHSRGGLIFYLSRRINVLHYAVGKVLAIGLLINLTTTLPALVLFIEYGLLGDSGKYFGENYSIVLGILGYGILLSIVVGLLLFALVSWMPKPVPLVMLWGGLFVFLPILSRILTFAMREPGVRRRIALEESPWRLLDFWYDLFVVGNSFFGIDKPLLTGATLVVCAICIFSVIAIVIRLRLLQYHS
jgi:ABC-2 type transport system permease protein|tara:strand:+ start:265 stop:1158 length:894 start_codon:yes stop_codon:yes gene_type:complete